ncbi:hypothetical protein H6F43_16765 [Leptolyngbya sp. FACHB-36]|nr:hypothetical protein [Leptolyngbya sp. FACHB-36]MBD2021835.1 hypothetical protein [Leptolyngbya sp. FACHB-36]
MTRISYPSNVTLPIDSPALAVPTEISPASVRNLAYAVGNSAGGYQV